METEDSPPNADLFVGLLTYLLLFFAYENTHIHFGTVSMLC